jgi:hypothetical protein
MVSRRSCFFPSMHELHCTTFNQPSSRPSASWTAVGILRQRHPAVSHGSKGPLSLPHLRSRLPTPFHQIGPFGTSRPGRDRRWIPHASETLGAAQNMVCPSASTPTFFPMHCRNVRYGIMRTRKGPTCHDPGLSMAYLRRWFRATFFVCGPAS